MRVFLRILVWLGGGLEADFLAPTVATTRPATGLISLLVIGVNDVGLKAQY